MSLANDCKALTWDTFCEHAVLRLEDGQRALVRGGRFAIDLNFAAANDPFGRPANLLWIDVEGNSARVVELILHTHPKPTGPSDADLLILKLLGQSESHLFEISGPNEGTIIRPKLRGDSHADKNC